MIFSPVPRGRGVVRTAKCRWKNLSLIRIEEVVAYSVEQIRAYEFDKFFVRLSNGNPPCRRLSRAETLCLAFDDK